MNDRRQLTSAEIDDLVKWARAGEGAEYVYRAVLRSYVDRIEDEFYADADLTDDDIEEMRLDSPVENTP